MRLRILDLDSDYIAIFIMPVYSFGTLPYTNYSRSCRHVMFVSKNCESVNVHS